MYYLKVKGGLPLNGQMVVSGSKNSFLPIFAAALIVKGIVTISNVPQILDVFTIGEIAANAGASFQFTPNGVVLVDGSHISNPSVSQKASEMRASMLVIPAILQKLGEVTIPMPGGCPLGNRGVDFHAMVFSRLGANVIVTDKGLNISLNKGGLIGAEIEFPKISVGATQNAIIAGCIATGITTIKNASMEPETIHLIEFLNSCGAKITGGGTQTIVIEGKKNLMQLQSNYVLPPDRIEATTYALAVLGVGGTVEFHGASRHTVHAELLESIGGNVSALSDGVVVRKVRELTPMLLSTGPYPGFATDLHSPVAAVLSRGNGTSIIKEEVHKSRFGHVDELNKLGANMFVKDNATIIKSTKKLTGAFGLIAKDLRSAKALVIAALMAEGESTIHNLVHLKRGYNDLPTKLNNLGACITECKTNEPENKFVAMIKTTTR